MTKKQLVATKIDIPTSPFIKEGFLDLTEQIYEKALDNLINSLREIAEEDAPYEILRAFALTYFDLEFTQDYDIRTMEYKLFCTPKWKNVNEIDTKSEEFKLIRKYSWDSDVE